jgi:hypothetical protein
VDLTKCQLTLASQIYFADPFGDLVVASDSGGSQLGHIPGLGRDEQGQRVAQPEADEFGRHLQTVERKRYRRPGGGQRAEGQHTAPRLLQAEAPGACHSWGQARPGPC